MTDKSASVGHKQAKQASLNRYALSKYHILRQPNSKKQDRQYAPSIRLFKCKRKQPDLKLFCSFMEQKLEFCENEPLVF